MEKVKTVRVTKSVDVDSLILALDLPEGSLLLKLQYDILRGDGLLYYQRPENDEDRKDMERVMKLGVE